MVHIHYMRGGYMGSISTYIMLPFRHLIASWRLQASSRQILLHRQMKSIYDITCHKKSIASINTPERVDYFRWQLLQLIMASAQIALHYFSCLLAFHSIKKTEFKQLRMLFLSKFYWHLFLVLSTLYLKSKLTDIIQFVCV